MKKTNVVQEIVELRQSLREMKGKIRHRCDFTRFDCPECGRITPSFKTEIFIGSNNTNTQSGTGYMYIHSPLDWVDAMYCSICGNQFKKDSSIRYIKIEDKEIGK